MSKEIISLDQNNDGAINPGTDLFEQPIWEITLVGDYASKYEKEERTLGKAKMEEYISKSFNKTVHRFKRWKVKTTTGETFVYVIVFSDRTHEMVSTKEMMDIVYKGHSVRNKEEFQYIDTELAAKGGHSPIFIPTDV
tara:strand:- start:603 stop:1016 length:414 start_codon:yes stop_codon:yes gene_type:complete